MFEPLEHGGEGLCAALVARVGDLEDFHDLQAAKLTALWLLLNLSTWIFRNQCASPWSQAFQWLVYDGTCPIVRTAAGWQLSVEVETNSFHIH